jgi:hypothetical protein
MEELHRPEPDDSRRHLRAVKFCDQLTGGKRGESTTHLSYRRNKGVILAYSGDDVTHGPAFEGLLHPSLKHHLA